MQISGVQSGLASLASSVSKVSSSAYYDPRDLNQDGIVSAVEEQTYSLKHPGLDTLTTSSTTSSGTSSFTQYGKDGGLSGVDGNPAKGLGSAPASARTGATGAMGSSQSGALGSSSTQAANSTSTHYDPQDLNQDGVVTAEETFLYSLKHPELAAQAASASNGSALNAYQQNRFSGANSGGSMDLFA
jgi:hypothetical protein